MFDRIVRKTLDILQVVAGALFCALFVLNILRIAMRYIAGSAWIWLPDVSRLLFIWTVFVGASVLVGRNGHLLMDYFLEKMGATARTVAQVVIQLGQILFCLVMVTGGTRIAIVRMRIPFDTWDAPTGWAYLAVPVCGALMIAFSLNNIVQLCSSKREEA
jgi:TRAP-type C4-dicarboxylate transport system permease small subunit